MVIVPVSNRASAMACRSNAWAAILRTPCAVAIAESDLRRSPNHLNRLLQLGGVEVSVSIMNTDDRMSHNTPTGLLGNAPTSHFANGVGSPCVDLHLRPDSFAVPIVELGPDRTKSGESLAGADSGSGFTEQQCLGILTPLSQQPVEEWRELAVYGD